MTQEEADRLEQVWRRIEEVARGLEEVKECVEYVRTEQKIIRNIPSQVAERIGELKGAVDTLTDLVTARANQTDGKIDKASSFKNALQFAGVVLVPLLVALIGALVVIHAGAPSTH